jgi:hypothetical protein
MNSLQSRRTGVFILLWLILGGLLGQNVSRAAIPNSLVAYYPFISNVNDESGNGLNGYIAGGIVFGTDRFGIEGRTAVFNGANSKITVPNSPALRLPEGTWSVWIKPAGGTLYPYIIDQDTYGSTQDGHLELNPDNSVSFCIEDDIEHDYKRVMTDAGAAPLDQWTNIVVTWGGGGMKIYINGLLISANSYVKGITSPGDLVIGSNFANYQNPGAPWFNGAIDDIRIYDRALSNAEIQALYGLVAYYPFNGNAYDESGNGHHGNILGGLAFGMDRFGAVVSGAAFNGIDTKITVPNSPALRLTEGTWSVWIKPEGGASHPYIIDQDTYGWTQDGHLELHPDNSVSFIIEDDIDHNYKYLSTAAGAAPQNQWTNIVATWGSEGMKLYVNGVLVSTNSYSKGITSPGDLVIGSNFANYQNPGAPWFNGSIDDIRIYDRALSNTEIQALYGANNPPIAKCKDLELVANGQCQAFIVAKDVDNGSCDPDGDQLTYSVDFAGPFQVGDIRYVTLTVGDGKGGMDSCMAKVTVVDKTSPVPDLAVLPALTGECSVDVTAIPTAWDNCSGRLNAATTDPLHYTAQGTYTVTWTYDDHHGNIATQSQNVIVKDTIPPVISQIAASPNEFWPPNHKLMPVTISVFASDNCATLPQSEIVKVTCNEPINGPGDGNTDPDWLLTGKLSLNLRSERDGNGNGRIYTITVLCKDAAGNSTLKDVTVTVPKSKGK